MAKPKIARPGSKPGHNPEEGYNIKARVWIEKDGELYLGWGRVLLLERIDKLGSIAAAAREMKLTYRNAWLWIDAMNRLAPSPLVQKTIGGGGGGHAELTEEGHKAVKLYQDLRQRLSRIVKQDAGASTSPAGKPR
jgi:molybdate transport system regulatory protein